MVSRRHAFRRGFGGHYFGPKWPCRLSLALVPVSSLVLSLRGKLQITRSHVVLIRFPSSWMHSKACIQTNRCATSYLGHRLRIAGNSDFCPEDRKSRYIFLGMAAFSSTSQSVIVWFSHVVPCRLVILYPSIMLKQS